MFRLKTTKIRIFAAFLKQNWWIIGITSLSLVLLYFFGPSLLKLFNARRENDFRIGIVGNYTLQTLPKEIESKITMGLTRVSQEGEALPGGALNWQIKNEGKTYIFNLDPTLKWHNGKPLTTEDIDYNFEGVEKTILSPQQIQFDLQEAFAPFPARTSEALYVKGVIGLGDFKIKSLETRLGDILSKLELVPNYKNINQKYTFEFFPTEENLKNAFLLAQVEEAWGLTNVDEFKDWSNVKIIPDRQFDEKYAAIFFNTREDKLYSDKTIRQALAYGVEKPPKETRALGPISPLSWAYNKNVKTYDYNPSHAKSLLEDIEINPAEIEINLTTFPGLLTWADRIKQDWEELGFKVNVTVETGGLNDYDVLLGYGVITQDPDQYYFWHSDQPGNITNFSNARIDKLLEDGRSVTVKEERKTIYQDFQRFLVEESPAIFLFYPESYKIVREPLIDY